MLNNIYTGARPQELEWCVNVLGIFNRIGYIHNHYTMIC